ncbi:MAG: 7-carboxy-7-deazaguanine synthase QueE [Gammaproteobacteria bacterium]|nr:7-carboxy-7-deazaguanine synthase QueE [Gammaproteobacteria bacterium]
MRAEATAPVPLTPGSAPDITLRVNEIFLSLQGETTRAGLPTIFIRLTGCPLRCHYCDTAYAFHEGRTMTAADIMAALAPWTTRLVTVTGGEPLAQKSCQALLTHLCDRGYDVSLETGGAIDVSAVDARVCKILDVKTPGSGESGRNLAGNLAHMSARDQFKFVICDRRDYEWAREFVAHHQLHNRSEVLFSPSHGQLPARDLADWVVADELTVRLQIQLHKYLWGDERGR